jgi:WD40 repeat protein
VQLGDAHFMMRLVLLIVLMPIATFLEPRGSAHALELLAYFWSLRDAFFDAFLDELRGGLLLFAISTQRQTQPRTEGKGEPHIVVGCTDGTVRVFCPGVDTGGKVIGTHRGRVPVGCLEVSEELGTFLTGAEDGSIQAWDIPHCMHTTSGDPMLWRRTEHRNEAVLRLKVVPNSDIFVSTAGDSVCLVRALKKGTLLAAFVGHQRPVEHLVLLPIGTACTWVLSGGRDEAMVRMWQVDEGALAVHRTRQNRYVSYYIVLRI